MGKTRKVASREKERASEKQTRVQTVDYKGRALPLYHHILHDTINTANSSLLSLTLFQYYQNTSINSIDLSIFIQQHNGNPNHAVEEGM